MSILVLWITLFQDLHQFPELPDFKDIQPTIPPFFSTMQYNKDKKGKRKRKRKIVVAVPTSDDDGEYDEGNEDE